ncbi:response regulator transcription factor [Terriglobus sp. TAA 43]|uniref:response regulator transcription factor n=1 Tax=Terriglobus sp. TAA 43 TaxID=278961 RepID=UPI00068BF9BE|nr:response regulator [Terriglobus sp. TAA 43]
MTDCTVHIVDDDSSLCRAMSRLLRAYEYGVETYAHPAQFINRVLPPVPACVLLDLRLSKVDGLDVQEIISRNADGPPIVFMSGHADVESSLRALKGGAVDFLLKPFDDHQLLASVQTALSLSEQAKRKRDSIRRDHMAFASLTLRERQVCLRIVQGLLNKQVGYELGTTEKTVKAQRAHVMQKLGADSLPDVVRLVDRLRSAGFLQSELLAVPRS